MNLPSKIHIYVFGDGEQVKKEISDKRIYRCASLFIETERKIRPDFPLLLGNTCPEIVRQEGEKPCFKPDIGLYFSVSHSGKFWVCAVSKQEIGIDIQNRTCRYQRAVARRFFHPDEYEYLEKKDFSDFFPVWTAKESYVKYTGQGIGEGFSDFSVVVQDRISNNINGVQIRSLTLDMDYCLYICSAEIIEANVIILSCDENYRHKH